MTIHKYPLVDAFHILLLTLSAVFLLRCAGGPSSETDSEPVPVEVQTAREIAAAYFADDRLVESREAIDPLLDRETVNPEDLLRAAVVELALDQDDQARELLQQASERTRDSARYHYLSGILARRDGDFEGSKESLQRALELAEDDIPTRLMLAIALSDTGDPAAMQHLRRIVELGPEFGGSWYVTANYRLGRLLLQAGEMEEASARLQEHSVIQARGVAAVSDVEVERGTFGRLDFPAPSPRPRRDPAPPPSFEQPVFVAALVGMKTLAVADLETTWRVEDDGAQSAPTEIGSLDLVVSGPEGLFAVSASGDGEWETRRLFDGPVEVYRGFDLGQDGDLDYWVVSEGRLVLLVAEDLSLAPSSLALPALPSAPRDLEVLDYDHDGDLDLLLVGAFGVRLWRDDGAALDGTFNDATAEIGIETSQTFDWCIAEDFDTDQDVDWIAGGQGGVLLADNVRSGRFEDQSARLPEELVADVEPVIADLDGDSRPDIWTANGDLWLGTPSGNYEPGGADRKLAFPSPGSVLTDLNLDGEMDLLGTGQQGSVEVLLSVGAATQSVVALTEPETPVANAVVALSPTSDRRFAWTLMREESVELRRAAETRRRGLRLALRGTKDNRRGVGAIVEVRAGEIYQRIYWRGEPTLIGLDDREEADWIRVTWPNGVIQSEIGVPSDIDHVIEQVEGLVGSCPFLYTWNGETYGFVSDVLGITPLGLPMSHEQMVPPDHDEFVLIRGDQLVERDGFYEVQITEELREVTYLDKARLDVVDHPAEVEIYPNERFTFPPFPEPHIHTVSQSVAPRRAMGSDGKDWTNEVGASDLTFAAPFEPYQTRPEANEFRGQFLGLAPPHWLELEFDPASLAGADRLRLVMTGWFFWTDSSVNMAISRIPSLAFVPPILQVPDGEGGWRDAGPPIGFPAGKVKTMVIDVDDVLDRGDPRLRVFSTLRLYWDSIRLAVDDDSAPREVTPLAVGSAELWERGFSEPYEIPGEHKLVWFDWDRLSPQPRWNQHPGLYTRLGRVDELLSEIDDRFVVMGAGDALTLRFDARRAPPLPEGWTRDYLLFLDGWAKDRDPNSRLAEMVEPLPFHGMSGYPYGPTESFPEDAVHVRWRLEWQTRQARRWIPPLHRERIRTAVPSAPWSH